ncbi:hypothetical protein RYX36_010845 [Vicia faba]
MSELTTELANTNITTSQENGDAAKKVYVGGIPYYSCEDGIHSYFESCGTITEINCMTFHDTAKFRGYADVDFSDSKSLKTTLALDQSSLFGSPIQISCAAPLKKTGCG